jgi:hypothetical protein
MTDEKKLFDELALDVNPAMAVKAKQAKRMMDDVRTSPDEARQFHLWRGIYAQTHGKVPDVADAFMAATVRERMAAANRDADFLASDVGSKALNLAMHCGECAALTDSDLLKALLKNADVTIKSLVAHIKGDK